MTDSEVIASLGETVQALLAERQQLRAAVSAIVNDPEATPQGPLTITRGQLDLLRAALK